MEPTESSGAPNGQRRTEDGGSGRNTVGARVDRINDTAQEAWTRSRDAVSNLRESLDIDGRVDRNPYGMLAAALGVGYVLGGGIFSPLTARIVGFGLRMGIRLAAIPFIKEELLGLAESVGDGSGEAGSKSRRAKQSNINKGR